MATAGAGEPGRPESSEGWEQALEQPGKAIHGSTGHSWGDWFPFLCSGSVWAPNHGGPQRSCRSFHQLLGGMGGPTTAVALC